MGLIEVLVAVLVMAIGLLGIAALQATALRNGQSSLERTQAVVLSYAIVDAMRANLTEARAGGYEIACQAPPPRSGRPTAGTLGFNDRVAWNALIRSQLGESGCGMIACAPVAGIEARDCRVTVRWDDSRGTAGNEQHEMTTVVRV